MARKLRVQEPGTTYHVIARATFGRKLFVENDDRRWFEFRLDDVVRRSEWSCKAHCLLGTHYHLLVTTPKPNLAEGMKRLNGMHAQSFNSRHDQRGHLVEDRYYSEPVKSEAHLLELFRYIALNPVRAGMCRHPAHWRWSSYAGSTGYAAAQPFLDLPEIYALFGRRRLDAQRALQELVEAGLACLQGPRPGSDPGLRLNGHPTRSSGA